MQTLYAGIDLHSNNNVVVVVNEEDTVVYRKRLRNELDAVTGALSPFEKDLSGVVVESTYNWYWMVDGLMDHGYRVHLANTGAIQQSIRASNMATTDRTHVGWQRCCVWTSCPKATSIPSRNERCAIWRVSAGGWFDNGRPTC